MARGTRTQDSYLTICFDLLFFILLYEIQGDQKVSVYLMIKVKTRKNVSKVQSLTIITYLELGIKDGGSVSLMSINVWRLAGETLNITCHFLCCNHQAHGDVLITLYLKERKQSCLLEVT
jgi:hypothetical protein